MPNEVTVLRGTVIHPPISQSCSKRVALERWVMYPQEIIEDREPQVVRMARSA